MTIEQERTGQAMELMKACELSDSAVLRGIGEAFFELERIGCDPGEDVVLSVRRILVNAALSLTITPVPRASIR